MPTVKYKSQGYNDRLDESLGMKHKGPHKQSMKARRDESKGESKHLTGHAYSGDHSMKEDKHYPKSVKSHIGKLIKK
tara:strand:+ start:195 stop:425 length:231 start_codon:yes stop_codon:yes gene_type:complete